MARSVNACADEYVKTRTLKILTRTASWGQKSMKILRRTDYFCWQNERRAAWERFRKTQNECHAAWEALRQMQNERGAAWERSTKTQNECHAAWECVFCLRVPTWSPQKGPLKTLQTICFKHFLAFWGTPLEHSRRACPKNGPSQVDAKELPRQSHKTFIFRTYFANFNLRDPFGGRS